MDSFLPRLSIPLFSLVHKYMVWFSRYEVFFFFLEGEEGGGLPLFPCPLFSPLLSFLAEVSPFTNPHAGNISISSLSTINHRQTPLLLWHQSVRRFPHRSPSPSKLLSRWMALSCLFPSPLRSLSRQEGRRGAESTGAFWEQDRAGHFDPQQLTTTQVFNSLPGGPSSSQPPCPDLPQAGRSPSAPQPALAPQHGGGPPPPLALPTHGAGSPLSPTLETPQIQRRDPLSPTTWPAMGLGGVPQPHTGGSPQPHTGVTPLSPTRGEGGPLSPTQG